MLVAPVRRLCHTRTHTHTHTHTHTLTGPAVCVSTKPLAALTKAPPADHSNKFRDTRRFAKMNNPRIPRDHTYNPLTGDIAPAKKPPPGVCVCVVCVCVCACNTHKHTHILSLSIYIYIYLSLSLSLVCEALSYSYMRP